MDANEEDSPTAELRQIMSSLNLIDVHNHLHDKNPAPTTYQRGTQQLDFLFISPGILPSLLTAGFLPYNIPF
eukprot:977357-Ditylum_brightwellii.AAC.1